MPVRTSLLALLALLTAAPAAATPAEELHALFAEEWRLRLSESPLLATSVGVHTYDDRLDEVSPEAIEAAAERRRGFLERLHRVDPAALDTQDRISYRVFERQMEDVLSDWRFGAHQIPLNSDSGFHSSLTFLPREMPFDTSAAYERYVARLRQVPRYFDQQIDNLRAGLARGMTLPREVLGGIDATIAAHVVADPAESVFHAPFESFPATMPAAERERLAAAGAAAIRDAVVPAYAELLAFWNDEYVPGARATLGARELPDGEAYYAHLVRRFTTLDVDARAVHELGLAEVERIRGEMDAILAATGFEGSYAEFLDFLRSDPRFYAETPQDLLERAAWIAKTMDGKLPALFATLPRLPYTVEPVPEHIAPKYTAGRYVPPPADGIRPGVYWVNTHDLASRPLFTLEALTLHEAVPGHHLQHAIAQELADLPDFRRHSYISAFGEGWGLYAEWLGIEAGFYQDPYSDFGRLTYEMWRACRLVVDTGLHALGWSRQRAHDYMAARTALSLHEVDTEIDRYVTWPGQALAYKMGEIEIKRLRRLAERELGPRFDVRRFHDAVLRNGSVPLPVLAEEIERFVAAEKGPSAPR
ncbi:MAG TPA: DUF885 domain-containing protein [Thermoanaerobaculia bacterium]|nr:DUF885 domain-containing protein [Thermoanaerobaculia bacterium]